VCIQTFYRLWGPHILLFDWYRFSFHRVYRPWLEVDRLSPSIAEVKNEWSYTSADPIVRLRLLDWDCCHVTNLSLLNNIYNSHRGGPGSIPGQSMWGLWWTKWHWDRFFPEFFGFPLSNSFHRCSITRKRTKNNHNLHLHHHRVA
jgi:hypothetical protein